MLFCVCAFVPMVIVHLNVLCCLGQVHDYCVCVFMVFGCLLSDYCVPLNSVFVHA